MTAERYRPVAFYRLTRLSQDQVKRLKEDIEQRLAQLGIVGRIYLAPEQGISGINCQMAVPVSALASMRQFFDGLGLGPISYTEGLDDLEAPCFRKLRVLIKENVSQSESSSSWMGSE
ncbi:hypothetical protein BX666DRAFT_1854523 [Dichotomocladium elegans]|nr:hypothetical protein BX666DRAFT_1854523 [Dichotomocladium elegans]